MGFVFTGCLAAALLIVAIWLFRTRPWAGARTRYPIVLVHGILGFGEIGIGSGRGEYFRGIPTHLRSLGVTVVCPQLPPLGTVAERAASLAGFLRGLPQRKINVIAHSMGGLDARYAISRLGCARKVASLTTIGTPHKGTPLADTGHALGLGRLLSIAGVDRQTLVDLTCDQSRRFNEQAHNSRKVHYFCIIGQAREEHLHPLLKPSHAYLQRSSGRSDGLVPTASQAWGPVLERIEADHWAQIGWSSGLDAPALYERIARLLRRRGL